MVSHRNFSSFKIFLQNFRQYVLTRRGLRRVKAGTQFWRNILKEEIVRKNWKIQTKPPKKTKPENSNGISISSLESPQ